jgi:hypothetical protein
VPLTITLKLVQFYVRAEDQWPCGAINCPVRVSVCVALHVSVYVHLIVSVGVCAVVSVHLHVNAFVEGHVALVASMFLPGQV